MHMIFEYSSRQQKVSSKLCYNFECSHVFQTIRKLTLAEINFDFYRMDFSMTLPCPIGKQISSKNLYNIKSKHRNRPEIIARRANYMIY